MHASTIQFNVQIFSLPNNSSSGRQVMETCIANQTVQASSIRLGFNTLNISIPVLGHKFFVSDVFMIETYCTVSKCCLRCGVSLLFSAAWTWGSWQGKVIMYYSYKQLHLLPAIGVSGFAPVAPLKWLIGLIIICCLVSVGDILRLGCNKLWWESCIEDFVVNLQFCRWRTVSSVL